MGRFLIMIGLATVVTGLLITFGGRFGLGHLPGDLTFKGERYALHVPLVTCLVVSVALSGLFWLIRRFF